MSGCQFPPLHNQIPNQSNAIFMFGPSLSPLPIWLEWLVLRHTLVCQSGFIWIWSEMASIQMISVFCPTKLFCVFFAKISSQVISLVVCLENWCLLLWSDVQDRKIGAKKTSLHNRHNDTTSVTPDKDCSHLFLLATEVKTGQIVVGESELKLEFTQKIKKNRRYLDPLKSESIGEYKFTLFWDIKKFDLQK